MRDILKIEGRKAIIFTCLHKTILIMLDETFAFIFDSHGGIRDNSSCLYEFDSIKNMLLFLRRLYYYSRDELFECNLIIPSLVSPPESPSSQ
jgi:hypothetical protein